MSAKKDAAAKGFTITAQMLQFILGLGLVIIIMFALLFYVATNQYERVARMETASLHNRIKDVCESGLPQTMDFTLPQGLGFQDFIKKKIGLSTNVLIDPYFYVYYERFPPEPPYQFLNGPVETAESVIAPWSEDLPWSSNILLTTALDISAFGHVPGYENMQNGFSELTTKLESSRLKPLVDAGRILNDGQKIILGNKKVLTGIIVGGTLVCKAATDLSLEQCAVYSGGLYIMSRVGYKVSQSVFGKTAEWLATKNPSIEYRALDDLAQKLTGDGQQITLQSLQDEIEYGGQKFKFIDHIDSQGRGVVTKSEYWDALESLWAQDGQPSKIGAFTFEKDTATGALKEVFLEKTGLDGPWTKFKDSLNVLDESIGKIVGSDVISPDGEEKFATALEMSVKTDSGTMGDIIKSAKAGGIYSLNYIDPKNPREVQDFALKAVEMLRSRSSSGYITLIEKGSSIPQYLMIPSSDAETTINHFLEYLKNDAAKNPEEAARLVNWLSGKELRIGEKMAPVLKGTLGYSFLRVQDLYTPLGASYWDKTISTFNNPLLSCGNNQLCLQFGFNVIDKYDLPPQCDVKLDRNSFVAKDPRFYLVSPCFSKLDIIKKGNTVYVNPHICNKAPADYSDNPNYCYATSGYVDYYVTSETGAFFADCIATGLCSFSHSVVTGGASGALAVAEVAAKCFGVKQLTKTGPCAYLGSSIRLLVDLQRESITSYPYVPDYIMNSFGADSNRYVGC